jgi:hypothetical protein
MHRLSRWLFYPVQHYVAEARALLQGNTTTENVAAVALALQAKDNEKVLLIKEKDNEKVLLMQQFAPVYNRRAVEELTMFLAKLHPDCSVRNQHEQLVISATIRKLRRKLVTCTNAKTLRGASTIYKTLSTDLHNMPLPMSIESARWTGLRADEKAFMEDTYTKLQRFGLIKFQQKTD